MPRTFFSPLSASFSIGVVVGFLRQVGIKAASLNHEPCDHPMKDRTVVVSRVHVVQKVGDSLWRFRGVELKDDLAERRLEFHRGAAAGCRAIGRRRVA